jgi:hypothetical protein
MEEILSVTGKRGPESGTDSVRAEQEYIYSRQWEEYGWNGECLFPVMLTLERILAGSTARLHTPHEPHEFNVIGTPRSGTKWIQKILTLLSESDRKGRILRKAASLLRIDTSVRHYHEGLIGDFSKNQKIVFVYRDIRDCIVSGYHYHKNGLHPGTMGCTPEHTCLPRTRRGRQLSQAGCQSLLLADQDAQLSRSDTRILRDREDHIRRWQSFGMTLTSRTCPP